MTHYTWTFDREFPDIECRPYAPAFVAEPAIVRRGLDWRRFGQCVAGALWVGCGVGVLLAIIAA